MVEERDSNVAVVPAATQDRTFRRAWGDRGRLNVEMRLLGMVAAMWACSLAYGLLWGWIVVGDLAPIEKVPWLLLFAPQGIALIVVLAALVLQLPGTRWSRRGSLVQLPSPLPLLMLGFPALLFAPVLLLRDRRVRSSHAAPTVDAIERAFHRLVRLPRVAGLQFLLWLGLAFVGDAIILAVHFHWPRDVAIMLTVMWFALLGPNAAIVASRGRAILRPEYLTAPRASGRPIVRASNVAVKLAVNASIASIGAVTAPLAAGYLWLSTHSQRAALKSGEALAQAAIELAVGGRAVELGRLIGEHPGLSVREGQQSYGRKLVAMADREGTVDWDGDGQQDIVVRNAGSIVAIAPVGPPAPIPIHLLVLGGLVCALTAVGAIALVARDTRRDVMRATMQVDAVARGAAPPPLTEASFSTREIRQLVQAVDRLVNRITETNVARYIAIEKAKEADRIKSQFLANMSHDLRSPLNSILGFSELLLTGIDGDLTPDQREMVQTIHDSGRDLLQQIDDILDTAKIEAARMEIHPEPSPPATLISRAIQSARRRRTAAVEYHTDVAPGLPPAFVDPYRTVQAIENVLLFAAERLTDEAIDVRLRPVHGEDGRMIVIRIATPVAPATREQLVRARRGFSRIPGHTGLGLGLPIANAILELEAGSLGIEEDKDGMTFTISLPAPETRRMARTRGT